MQVLNQTQKTANGQRQAGHVSAMRMQGAPT